MESKGYIRKIETLEVITRFVPKLGGHITEPARTVYVKYPSDFNAIPNIKN